MTETERIIQNGVLPASFFLPETRSGYYVSENMKKLWGINIDLILEFDRVCKKHGLNYFLFYGSLLGTIRHKGFVPWDDDVDIYMLRDDYNKLLKLDRSEFKYPYFLQTPYTEKNFFYSTIRLRNSNTAFIDYPFKYYKINHGIALGIGPIDYYPLHNAKAIYAEIFDMIMDIAAYIRLDHPYLIDRDRKRVVSFIERGGLQKDMLQVWEKINEMSCGDKASGKYWIGVQQHYGMEKGVFDIKDFSDTIDGEFEGFRFPIPSGFDNILRTIYGDYLQFPAEEIRGKWHSNVVFDPDISYVDYLENEGIIYEKKE